MAVEAHPTPPGSAPPTPAVTAVSDDYFSALDIPLLAGRLPSSRDRGDTEHIGVVDEVAARTLWPNENPIGQRIRYVWNEEWITVVGVVGNVKRDDLTADPVPSLYVPFVQNPPRHMRLFLRVDERMAPSPAIIRSTLEGIDRTVPIERVDAMETLVLGSTATTKLAAVLLGSFALIALLLGSVGVYGVMSANVNRRTRELGVRMALGAQRVQVLRMVLQQGMRLVIAGVVVGVALAIAGARLIESYLYGVSPFDLLIFVSVPVVLLTTAVMATFVPALRASRVAPMEAIRGE
jgi:putative ABC transport system permease protein